MYNQFKFKLKTTKSLSTLVAPCNEKNVTFVAKPMELQNFTRTAYQVSVPSAFLEFSRLSIQLDKICDTLLVNTTTGKATPDSTQIETFRNTWSQKKKLTLAAVGADRVVNIPASGAVKLHRLLLGLVENANLQSPTNITCSRCKRWIPETTVKSRRCCDTDCNSE